MKAFSSLVVLAAAACVTSENAPGTYEAVGSEPFWSVTIGGGRMTYSAPGDSDISVATPRRQATANGHRYQTPQLTVEVVYTPCEDGMNGDRYEHVVTVTTGGGTLHGCGGEPR